MTDPSLTNRFDHFTAKRETVKNRLVLQHVLPMSTIKLDSSRDIHAGSATESPQVCHFSNNDFDGEPHLFAANKH
jgi:hypothetical protein